MCKRVPKGRVTTYKAIGDKLRTKAYRAIGTALNKNPYAPKVPCHRVINSNRSVGGFAKGINAKKKLLREEGIFINKHNKVEIKYLFRFK